VHAHFLTDGYVIAARAAGHVHPDGMAGWPNWSAEEHLRLMDRWGMATAMLSISSPGTHLGDDAAARRVTREVNEAGAAISRANPGRFGHFASLPLPDVAGAAIKALWSARSPAALLRRWEFWRPVRSRRRAH
jgi:6-methylsalicylate decarboxylase